MKKQVMRMKKYQIEHLFHLIWKIKVDKRFKITYRVEMISIICYNSTIKD